MQKPHSEFDFKRSNNIGTIDKSRRSAALLRKKWQGRTRMKETIRSLRAYFIVMGLISLLPSFGVLAGGLKPQGNGALVVGGIVGLGLSIMYLYMGVRLKSLLTNNPGFVKGVILAVMAVIVVNFLFHMAGVEPGPLGAEAVITGIGLLINWYLLRNVSRLAGDS